MIRFIDLTDQITDDEREFAFYDTVTGTFLTFSGWQKWSTVEAFKADYDGDDLARYLNLIPKEFGSWTARYGWKDIQVKIMGIPVGNIESINYNKLIEKSNLEIELQEAILNENYELAAKLKKEIDNYKE